MIWYLNVMYIPCKFMRKVTKQQRHEEKGQKSLNINSRASIYKIRRI